MEGQSPYPLLERCPLEILDHILDHLHDDKATLQSCSLVCQTFLTSTRFHLFYSIRITGVETKKTFDNFATFVQTSPHVASNVRELYLHPPSTPTSAICYQEPTKIVCSILCVVVFHLPQLRVLDIRFAYCNFDGPPKLLPVNRLRKIVLEVVEFDTCPDSFLNAMRTCPDLKVVDIRKSYWTSGIGGVKDSVIGSGPQIQALTLGHCRFASLTTFLNTIQSKLCFSSLTSLDIICGSLDDAVMVGNLVEEVGGSLLDLRLRLGSLLLQGTNAETCSKSLKLEHCTALRSFNILLTASNALNKLFRILLLSVQSIPSVAVIHRMIIGFTLHSEDPLQKLLMGLPWDEADEVIGSMKHLKEVSISLKEDLVLDRPTPVLEESLLRRVPRCRFIHLYPHHISGYLSSSLTIGPLHLLDNPNLNV
ncbi:hypothetical protein ABKN59_001540 [Abortiporus biennis]